MSADWRDQRSRSAWFSCGARRLRASAELFEVAPKRLLIAKDPVLGGSRAATLRRADSIASRFPTISPGLRVLSAKRPPRRSSERIPRFYP